MYALELLAARRVEASLVAAAVTVAFVADGPEAVPAAGVVGFFAAKSVESLRLSVAA